ncbi:ketopantoate reductase family protein [Streptomyces liangshanensis]|uniref:2-dehydropantoate 2-reductase n=1 Tax=Streptomyces liangshanensis TaxID=2717324 RepID=A0A6G9GSN5_9ACTN|nr:2-dehydropantoate 2-reductase [Streptomyces liangshanensis]QIQ01262.1 2-dehydropantoate 2-reductase [Streptomyces liangshanensis]
MDILIAGSGAVGGYVGHLLQGARRDVTFLARPASAQRLRNEGLKVRTADGTLHQESVAVLEGSTEEPYDLVILAPRASALPSVVRTLVDNGAVGAETRLLPLLNGMAHLDVLERTFGSRRVLGGAIRLAATQHPDGTVQVLAPGAGLEIGPLRYGDGVDRFADELRVPGLDVEVRADIVTAMWLKWVFIVGTAVVTIIGDGRIDEIAATPTGPELARAVLGEVRGITATEDVVLPERALQALGSALSDPSSRFAPSLYRDLVAGRPAEIDILDDLALRAENHNVPAPLLNAARVRLQVANNRVTPRT